MLRLVAFVLVAVSAAAGCSSDRPKTKAGDADACADVTTINQQLNTISDDLAGSKTLFADLSASAAKLDADAPSSLRADAAKLKSGIDTAKPFVDQARSIDELHALEQSDATLRAALNDLATYGSRVGDWKLAHCSS